MVPRPAAHIPCHTSYADQVWLSKVPGAARTSPRSLSRFARAPPSVDHGWPPGGAPTNQGAIPWRARQQRGRHGYMLMSGTQEGVNRKGRLQHGPRYLPGATCLQAHCSSMQPASKRGGASRQGATTSAASVHAPPRRVPPAPPALTLTHLSAPSRGGGTENEGLACVQGISCIGAPGGLRPHVVRHAAVLLSAFVSKQRLQARVRAVRRGCAAPALSQVHAPLI